MGTPWRKTRSPCETNGEEGSTTCASRIAASRPHATAIVKREAARRGFMNRAYSRNQTSWTRMDSRKRSVKRCFMRLRVDNLSVNDMDDDDASRAAELDAFFAELERVCPEAVDGLAVRGSKQPPPMSHAELTAVLKTLPDNAGADPFLAAWYAAAPS